jgi:hypothetical protein
MSKYIYAAILAALVATHIAFAAPLTVPIERVRLDGSFVESLRTIQMEGSPWNGWFFERLRLVFSKAADGSMRADLRVVYRDKDGMTNDEVYFSNAATTLNLDTGEFTVWVPFLVNWSHFAFYANELHKITGTIVVNANEGRSTAFSADALFYDLEGKVLSTASRADESEVHFDEWHVHPAGGSFYRYLRDTNSAGYAKLRSLGYELVASPRLIYDDGKNSILPGLITGSSELIFYVTGADGYDQVTCEVKRVRNDKRSEYELRDCEFDEADVESFSLGNAPQLELNNWHQTMALEAVPGTKAKAPARKDDVAVGIKPAQ